MAGGAVAAPVNLALNKTAVASSSENSTLPAAAAFDGNAKTRWSSAFSDPQWIYVDLGASYTVNKVKLKWDTAYAKAFKIQASNDARTWIDIYSTTSGSGDTQNLTVTQTKARYIRMYGTVRATVWGYSLFAMQVYGTAMTVNITNPGAQSTNINTPVNLQIKATHSGGNSL
ncbi:MAG: discoidin domain-containing protein, partial [Methylobacter sp.]